MSNEGPRKDPAWKYAHLENSHDVFTFVCNFCSKTTKGGVYRVKQHLTGGYRNVTTCRKCPNHVREEIREYMSKKKEVKEKKEVKYQRFFLQEVEDAKLNFDEEEGENDLVVNNPRKRLSSSRHHTKDGFESAESSRKNPRLNSPMNAQSTVNDARRKKMREHACQCIARWFYDAGIPLNACNYDSFGLMIEAIGQYGVGLKPPTYYELKVPLLRKELGILRELMTSHKEEWAKNGCTIIAEKWTDTRNRTLINFLVNSPKGTMFIESIDASSYIENGDKMFELLDKFVEHIGEDNVVQVVTDSTPASILAARLLEAKRPHLIWSPCVAQCLDMILEDISKIPNIMRTLKRGMEIRDYIYNRSNVLDMMRRFPNQKELDEPTKIQSINACVILSSIYRQKNNLRKMFTSNEWNNSKHSKKQQGRQIVQSVLMPTFWTTTVFALKVLGPLVQVRKLVDSNKCIKGYIRKAMESAMETIADSFNGKEDEYKDIFDIIDQRWKLQLHHPLHLAGYYFNPKFFYSNPHIRDDSGVAFGLFSCISRLVHSVEIQDKLLEELTLYRKAEGRFGRPIANSQSNILTPVQWWSYFGSSTPNLRDFAQKILSLACTAPSCERKKSIFKQLHSKKRNRLAQKCLNDIVFVNYNRALIRGYNTGDFSNPNCLEEINKSNEWLVGNIDSESKENDGSLPWSDDAKAGKEEEPTNCCGESISKTRKNISCSSTPIDVEVDSDESEEYIDNYELDGYEIEVVETFESYCKETGVELSNGNETEEEEEVDPDNYLSPDWEHEFDNLFSEDEF